MLDINAHKFQESPGSKDQVMTGRRRQFVVPPQIFTSICAKPKLHRTLVDVLSFPLIPYPFFLTSLLFCSTLFCISIPSTKKSTQWQQPKKSEQSRTWGSTPLRSRSNISCSSAGFSLMSFLLVRCFLSFLREMNLGADFFLSLFLSLSGLVFFLYFLL